MEESFFANLKPWLEKLYPYRLPLIILAIGGLLLILGLSQSKPNEPEDNLILLTESTSATASANLVVDVSGAVVSPGVFRLTQGSRIADALEAAGGLAPEADADYVARQVNQAQLLEDGQKVFIAAKTGREVSSEATSTNDNLNTKINLNTASESALEDLWGIGPARAQAIIQNRPYTLIQEIMTKAKIPANVFERIKDQIAVY